MASYALIACAKTKAEQRSRALQLYTSPLFRKSLLHALRARCQPFVLSAEFGLVFPEQMLPPYDKSLKTMGADEARRWAKHVSSQLRQLLSSRDSVQLYGGHSYVKPLLDTLRSIGCRVHVPIEGALGTRLSLLKHLNQEEKLHSQLREYYKLTRLLEDSEGQGMLVGALQESRIRMPTRGLYQFVDPCEMALGKLSGRVTRIGTHAVSTGAKSTLQGRINTHRGPKSGVGSHRSSIFRLHVGNAIKRSSPKRWNVPTWSQGSSAPALIRKGEAKLELEVSNYIKKHKVYWLAIQDEPGPASDRAFLERNIIGLLSSANLLQRTRQSGWLGELSADYRIALSGLWNLDHLFLTPHDDFIEVYRTYVELQINKKPSPEKGIAPSGWRQQMTSQSNSKQLDLF